MTKLEKLIELNPGLKISSVSDRSFSLYGRIIEDLRGESMLKTTESLFNDDGGTNYEASVEVLESGDGFEYIRKNIFGETEIQAGCCWGENILLNGMEYHNSSEVIGAATPMLLMLGRLQDISGGFWDSAKADCYLIPAGIWIEIYATTLHLAPCRISSEIFRAVIILPRGTNTPLDFGPEGRLWMKNKWMLAHPEGPAAKKGAAIAVTGENLRLNPLP